MSSFMPPPSNAETWAWHCIAVVNQSVDPSEPAPEQCESAEVRVPATARQWSKAGPSRLGEVPEPPNFAGPSARNVLVCGPSAGWFG